MRKEEPDLLAELKRRGVFRVAAMYAVVAWLIVQVADATFDVLGISESAHRILILVAAAGFPVALALGWIYDWRAGRLTRTGPAGETETAPDAEVVRLQGRRRIDIAIIVALVLALALALFGRDLGNVPDATAQPASLVVLPFDDLSPGGDEEYFAHGLSEELMAALAQLPDVRVIGRTSAEAAKRSGKGVGAIGEDLGVEAVVDGSVRRSEDRVRVTVQLLRASDAVGIWTKTYERPMGDLFSLQAQLAADAAAALGRRLEAATADRPTESLAAYDAYLTGRHLMGRQTPEALMEAEQNFERATRADPDFALAWSGLSDVLTLSWTLGFVVGDDIVPRAVAAASRAVDLAPDSAEALTSLGRIQWLKREWRASEKSLRRAIEKNPSYAFAYQSLSLVLVNLGEFEDGVAAIHRTVDLEPLSPYMHVNLASILDTTRDPQGALRAAQQASRLEPNNQFARFYASTSLHYLGQSEAARDEMLKSPLPESFLAMLRAAWTRGGMDEMRRTFHHVVIEQTGDPCGGQQGAITYAFIGEADKALTCLEGNIDVPGMYANMYLAQSPSFDSLRDSPRFAKVLERVGLAGVATPGQSLGSDESL